MLTFLSLTELWNLIMRPLRRPVMKCPTGKSVLTETVHEFHWENAINLYLLCIAFTLPQLSCFWVYVHVRICVHLYAVCSTCICISIHCTSYYQVAISVSMLTKIAIVHTYSITLNSLWDYLIWTCRLLIAFFRWMHERLEWSLFSPIFWAILGYITVHKFVYQSYSPINVYLNLCDPKNLASFGF